MRTMSAAPRKSLFSSLASTADHERLPNALVEWVKAQPRNAKADAAEQGLDGLKDGLRLTEVVAQM